MAMQCCASSSYLARPRALVPAVRPQPHTGRRANYNTPVLGLGRGLPSPTPSYHQSLTAQWRPSVSTAAAMWPPVLPPNLGEKVFEGAISLAMVCLWVSVLYMSINALAAFSAASTGSAVATRSGFMTAATSTAAAWESGVAVQAVNPAILLLRAIAATLGVAISGAAGMVKAVPALLFNVLRLLVVSIAGSLFHLLS